MGKLGALALAAPGILIKLWGCYTALAVASRSPSTVLRVVTGPLRDELRELASIQFWRAAVTPWMRPEHLIIVVSENVIQGTTVCGRCAPGEVLVSYGFPGGEPEKFRGAIPTLFLFRGERQTPRAER
jgi:hypothetical protein